MRKFSKYPKYKSSGIDWLGDIPEHWDAVPIKALSIVKRGASPRPIDNPDYFDSDGEFAWVRISDVTASNGILQETEQRLSALGNSLSVKLLPGDMFLSIAGSVGKPCILGIKACIHDGFVYFPNLKINKLFLYRIFEAGNCYQGLGKLGTQLNLNTDTIGAIRIALPCLSEQQEIAEFLDRETGKIDLLLSKREKLIELMQEKRSALISHAVTKGLNPKAKMKPSGIEWLGDIPAYWEIKRLKYNFFLKTKKAVTDLNPIALENIASWTGNFIETASEFEGEGVAFEKGDILFGKLRPYLAKVFLSETSGEAIGDLFVMSPQRAVYAKYAAYVLRTRDFIEIVDGSTYGSKMPRASWEFLGGLPFLLPPLSEQQAIAEFLDRETGKIDSLIEKEKIIIEKLREYRSALISEAVTGKIDVRK